MAKNDITEPRPNYPSFDFDPEKGLPNLKAGETVVKVDEVEGIPLYVTDGGRSIFVCSIAEFEAKVSGLRRPEVWAHYYPQAVEKVKKFKLRSELLGKTGGSKAAQAVTEAATGGGGGGIE